MQPWPKTYTDWLRTDRAPLRLILNNVAVTGQQTERPAGTIVVAEGDDLLVATGDGLLAIRQIQPAGKRLMACRDFLRGYPLRPGDRLAATAAA